MELPDIVASRAAKPISMSLQQWMSNVKTVLFEEKFDGTRIWIFKTGKSVVMATRHGCAYSTKQYPELLGAVADITDEYRLILDGEFLKREGRIAVFDVISYRDEVVSDKYSLRERKRMLDAILLNDKVFKVEYKETDNIEEINSFKDTVISRGGEGIVVKNPMSKYHDPNAWLKIKRYEDFDVFVTGKIIGDGGGPAFEIAGYVDGKITALGKVGSFSKDVDVSKIANGTVLEIRCQQVTDAHHFRNPTACRIRDDKIQRECIIA